ncbi:MAG TPA: glycosyltransferase family 87 protein [Acidobacteriaceae bacterium]|nr:glycosyltransferase family 87 protein [Acidobacteriaceae bacterium]
MVPADTQNSGVRTHDKRLLLFVVASLVLANVVQWGACRVLGLGNPGGLKDLVLAFTHVTQWTDSWRPMMMSLDAFRAHPSQAIYGAKLYDTLIYPLASLLPMVLLRKLGLGDAAMLRVLAWASWMAVLGVAAVSIALARRLLRERGAALTWPSILAIVLAVLGCYPLLKGYALGNAQTFLSLGFVVMLYLWTARRERSAGVVAALLTMVKPQFVLLLVWMAVRRRWGAMWAFLATAAAVTAVSIAVFGWHNNLDYIGVIAGLSHKAQSHFANQSMFGTINRMILNGENIGYTPYVYTPYIPWVYRVTVLTALLIVGAALVFPWGRLRGSTADIAAMGLASVAASPMAWEHHYGIVVGIFVWVWFAYGCWQRKGPWLLGVAFFLTMNFLAATNLLADRRGWNVLQSYMYFGALLLLFVLMRLARRVTRGDAVVL